MSIFDIMPEKKVTDLTVVEFNPLADYKAQMIGRKLNETTKVSNTSLSEEIVLDLDVNKRIKEGDVTFRKTITGFEHSKVISSAENRDILMSLRPTSQRLFIFILFLLEFRDDTITLDYQNMNSLGLKMTNTTFRQAVTDLEAKDIIKRKPVKPREPKYWDFFINPQILFKGDALNFYKDLDKVHPEYKIAQSLTVKKKYHFTKNRNDRDMGKA